MQRDAHGLTTDEEKSREYDQGGCIGHLEVASLTSNKEFGVAISHFLPQRILAL